MRRKSELCLQNLKLFGMFLEGFRQNMIYF
jgi:hypothetical protein